MQVNIEDNFFQEKASFLLMCLLIFADAIDGHRKARSVGMCEAPEQVPTRRIMSATQANSVTFWPHDRCEWMHRHRRTPLLGSALAKDAVSDCGAQEAKAKWCRHGGGDRKSSSHFGPRMLQ